MTENKKTKNPGIVIEDKYAQLIRKRLKKEIISTENLSNYVGKEIYLCGNFVYGSIILNEPLKLDSHLLDSHKKRHLITEDDILKLWPDSNIFYAYSFRINRMFKNPIKYNNTNKNFGIIEDINFIDKKEDNTTNMKTEEINLVDVNYYKDYEDKLDYLKKLEFSEKYKSVVESFLVLYELYLNKLLSKVYDGDGMVFKPEPDITASYIRIRLRNPKTIVEGTFRTIVISESDGIKGIIGKLKKDPTGPTHIQSVLFEKERWTVERAKEWVEDHKDTLKNMSYVKCSHCGKYFDYLAEKEAGMGYVKCPHCKASVDQEGKVYSEKNQDKYIDNDYITEDKDTGKQEPKWVWCKNCEKSFDYYKQLLDNKSTVLCPHCGALVIFEETE
jgi:DNA-directed RNA polymerase subunit RPC12/RpoP